jgi:hypothetical protein
VQPGQQQHFLAHRGVFEADAGRGSRAIRPPMQRTIPAFATPSAQFEQAARTGMIQTHELETCHAPSSIVLRQLGRKPPGTDIRFLPDAAAA